MPTSWTTLALASVARSAVNAIHFLTVGMRQRSSAAHEALALVYGGFFCVDPSVRVPNGKRFEKSAAWKYLRAELLPQSRAAAPD
jgi:hypothetical protein